MPGKPHLVSVCKGNTAEVAYKANKNIVMDSLLYVKAWVADSYTPAHVGSVYFVICYLVLLPGIPWLLLPVDSYFHFLIWVLIIYTKHHYVIIFFSLFNSFF